MPQFIATFKRQITQTAYHEIEASNMKEASKQAENFHCDFDLMEGSDWTDDVDFFQVTDIQLIKKESN